VLKALTFKPIAETVTMALDIRARKASRHGKSIFLFAGVVFIITMLVRQFRSSVQMEVMLSQETLRAFEAVGSQSTGEARGPQSTGVAPLSDDRKKLYNYHPPATQGVGAAEECGDTPDYSNYFKQNGKVRSVNNEDRSIYEMFFKKLSPTEMKDCTYVEMGGFNGRDESNSRFFDVCLGWKGLLLEANPRVFDDLVKNRPNAHLLNYAASCSPKEEAANKKIPFTFSIYTNAAMADTKNMKAYNTTGKVKFVDVPCGSITPALLDVFPHGHVTFFSLDVEGSEPGVVENLDFDKVFIEVMIIENRNAFCKEECAPREKARVRMLRAGYKLYENVITKSDLYVHPRSRFAAVTDALAT
jgi:hypothetical protein